MKKGWQTKKIGEVFQVTDYVANGSFATLRENVKYLDTPDYAVLVRLADFTNGFDKSKFVYVDKHAYDFLSKSSLKGGELIMSNVGSIGKVFKCPDLGMPMTLAPNSIVINTPNNDFYYYYFLSSDFQKKLLDISSQVTLAKFNKTSFKTLEIPIPPLSEQQRIVNLLDAEFAKIDTLKASAERNLQNAKDLLSKSIKETLCGFRQVCLNDLFTIRTGKLNSNEAVIGGKYPFFTCSREVFAIDKYAFDCEAVLLAGNNASGDFNVKYYNGKFNAYQRTYVITAKATHTNTRILYYVLTEFLSELKKMSLGANTKFLKLGMVEDVKVPIIDAKDIVVTINRLDALNEKCKTLQANYEKTIALCDDLKQALLRKAFNGEL